MVTNCDHLALFCRGQLEHEICGEPLAISFHLLIELLGADSIESRQVDVQHDLLAAQKQNRPVDAFAGNDRVLVFHVQERTEPGEKVTAFSKMIYCERYSPGLELVTSCDHLYACESGSRAWGFASKDSDYDVRFIYLRKPDWYLSIDLEHRRDVIELPIQDDLDINGWDFRKALRASLPSHGAE